MLEPRSALVWCCCLLLCACAAPAAELYVAPNGDDANPGTQAQPFATLARARDAVRALKQPGLPAGGIKVILRGGVYRLEQTLALTAEDSGSQNSPIVYTSAPGETARLVGGPAIPPEDFKAVTDPAVNARLDPAARGKVKVVDLAQLGVTNPGEAWPPVFRGYAGWPELFFDRQPMSIARWPNEGFAEVAKVIDSGSKPRVQEKPDRPGTFQYSGDRPERWLTADEVFLNGYWCFKWYDECLKVAKIDPEAKSITFEKPHMYGIGGVSGGFYFALGLLEELDQPGEYYVDRKANQLYFWPPAELQGQEIGLSLLKDPMISLTDTTDVRLERLTFEFSRNLAVNIAGGARNQVAGCTIRNLAIDAIRVGGGTDNGVLSCDLYNLGGAGISLSGGDRATLTPCGNYAENCHIHHFGRLYRTHKDAVNFNGVGCVAKHNLIHDAPHHAMDFGGNLHTVELNEIHDVCTETDDAGAIYTGRDWTVRGTVIKHNFWHDIGGSAHVGNQAIYVDDTACGVTSIGNVILRVYRGFLIGGGRDNVLDNNYIIDCKIPIHIDNRGLSWSGKGTENWGTLTTRLAAVPYQQEPWKSRFPKLFGILDDEPGVPKGNLVTRNLIVDCGKLHLAKEAVANGTIENNWETKDDPGFVDAAGMNFSLKDGAAALAQIKGLEPIPFDQIGLVKDAYRTVLPVNRPTILPNGGAFVAETEVRIVVDSRSPGEVVRYTLDGTEPTVASPVYTEPFKLAASGTVKAAAFAGQGLAMERSGTSAAEFSAQLLGPDHGIYLSDLNATESFAHGGLKRDVNYAGKGLVSINSASYPKSIMICPETSPDGNHSYAVYDLGGGLQRAKVLQATIGVDDAVGRRGSVTFAVEVERGGQWVKLFESKVVKGGDAPQPITVELGQADRLRLWCTDAGDDINADHAVWAGVMVQ